MMLLHVIFALFVQLHACLGHPDPVFAIVIFRHGDRTPIDPYPRDPWNDRKFWPVGWGQLTDAGKLRHFQLGTFLRDRYKNLLSATYDPDELYVRSTDYDRTIMSALSNLAGLYPVNKTSEWSPGLPWTPITVHTVPENLDELVAMKAPCPRHTLKLNELLSSGIYQEMNKKNAPLYEYLSNHSGSSVYSMLSASYLYDNLHIEALNNLTLPDWTKDVYPDKMKEIAQKEFLTLTYTPELARLLAGPLIKKIMEHLRDASLKLKPQKIIMYSGHDNTLSNVLNSLGMFKPHCPEYAAHLLFELLPGNSTDFVVRISYQNEVLHIPDCGDLCPLAQFIDIYSWLIPGNHETECALNNSFDFVSEMAVVGGILFCVAFLIIVLTMFTGWSMHKKQLIFDVQNFYNPMISK